MLFSNTAHVFNNVIGSFVVELTDCSKKSLFCFGDNVVMMIVERAVVGSLILYSDRLIHNRGECFG